jgi:Predicted AAA-ATPase
MWWLKSRCEILTFHNLYQPSETPLLASTSNFNDLVNTPNILAADKTVYIKDLDENPQYQLMFLRPRGWGKTTFLHMLANYYDLNKAHEFNNTFGQLYIGKNPTVDRSSLLVLLFDFSGITTVKPDEAKQALNDTLLSTLRDFLETNKRFLGYPTSESLLGDNGTNALRNVLVSLPIPSPHFWLTLFFAEPCNKVQAKALCWSRRVRRSRQCLSFLREYQ